MGAIVVQRGGDPLVAVEAVGPRKPSSDHHPVIWDTPDPDELVELLNCQRCLSEDRAEGSRGQLAVKRHNHGQMFSAQLDVTASLADLDGSRTYEATDNRCPAEDWKRRTHAESWKVVTTGFSNEIGST